jgi:DNA-binding transcriptional regulator YhcF (GntR family)
METLLQMRIDPQARASVSDQIKTHIKTRIRSGSVPAGQRLPSMRVLARHLNVSLTTVEKALRELSLEGVVEGKPGKGTFVTGNDATAHARTLSVGSMSCMIEEERQRVTKEFGALIPGAKLTVSDQNPDLLEVGFEQAVTVATELEDIDDLVCGLYGRREQGGEIFNAIRREGRLHILPIVWNHPCVLINADLFKKLGIPFPSVSWSWAESVELARATAKPEAGQYGFVAVGGWPYFLSLVLQNNGSIFDPSGVTCRLSEPEAVQAAEYVRALAPYGAPDGRRFAAVHKDFYEGRTAMLVTDNWWKTHMAGVANRFEVIVRPPPVAKRQAVLLRGTGFGIRKGTLARPLAERLLRLLADIEVWPHYIERHPIVPFHLRLQEADERTRIVLDTLRHAHTALDEILPDCRTPRHMEGLNLLEATIRVIRHSDMPIPGILAHLRDQMAAVIQPGQPAALRRASYHY